MVALLVAMSVMAIMMSVVLPTWRTLAQREKEAEAIFRLEQHARALVLYQKKYGPGTGPMDVEALVREKFLRKKYKDPLTGGDFQPLMAGQPQPGQPAGPGAGRGGIVGFVSKSTEKAFRIYNGRDTYNQWVFTATEMGQRMGVPTGGASSQPGRGGADPPGRGGNGTRGRGPASGVGDGRGGRGPVLGGRDGRGGNAGGGFGGRGMQPGRNPQPPGGNRGQ